MPPTLGDAVLYLKSNNDALNRGLADAEGKTKSWAAGLGGTVAKAVGGVAVAGVAALGATVGMAVKDGLALNATFENVQAQLLAFTKDGKVAEQILNDIREEAAKTPFAFQDMASATAALLPAAKASGAELMDLVKQAEVLAASNPAQGLEGAAFSLKEALSGDFTSIIERFNLPRQRLNQLKEEGVPALEAVQIAMSELGLDMDLVSNLAETSDGRWSTFWDTIDSIKSTLSQPLFDLIKEGLISVQGLLDANMPTIEAFVHTMGENLASGVRIAWDAIQQVIPVLLGMRDGFVAIIDYVQKVFSPGLAEGVTGRFQFVKDWIDKNMPLIQRTVKTVLDALSGFWNEHGDTIMTIVDLFMNTVWVAIETTMKAILGIVRAIMLIINGEWEMAWGEIGNVVQTIWDGINRIVGNQLEALKTLVVNFGPALWNAGKSLIGSLAQGVAEGFTQLIDYARSRMTDLRNLLPFSEPKDPTSPLRGLTRSGESIARQIQIGMDRVQLQVPPLAMAGASAMGDTYYFNQSFGANADVGQARQAVRDGLLDVQRRRGR